MGAAARPPPSKPKSTLLEAADGHGCNENPPTEAGNPRCVGLGTAEGQSQLARLLVHDAGCGVSIAVPCLPAGSWNVAVADQRQDRTSGSVHSARKLRMAAR